MSPDFVTKVRVVSALRQNVDLRQTRVSAGGALPPLPPLPPRPPPPPLLLSASPPSVVASVERGLERGRVLLRRRGVDPWSTSDGSTVGALVLLNLVLTFAIPSISVGGHLGGLLGGGAAAALVTSRRGGDTLRTVVLALALLLASTLIAQQVVTASFG